MHRWRVRFFEKILQFRAPLLLLGLLWCLLCLWLSRNVRPDFSVEQFFSLNSPQRQVFSAYQKDFPYEDNQVSVFWQQSQLQAQDYQDMKTLAQALKETGLNEVSWLGTAPQLSFLTLPFLILPQITPLLPANPSDEALHQTLKNAHSDPLYRNRFWNANQSIFLIGGFVPSELNQDRGRAQIEAQLTSVLQKLKRPGRKLVLSGIPIIRARYLKYLNQEQALYLGGGILLTCLVLFWFFRHSFQVFLSFTAIIPAYLTVLALMGLMHRPLTILTSTLPLILLLVGLSDTIHLLVHYRCQIQEQNDNRSAVVDTFSHFAAPCFYTSLTTAIGFLSLTSTGIRIIVDFALFTALGIMLTYVFAMLYFPLGLSFYRRQSFNDKGLELIWMKNLLHWAAGLPERHSRKVLLSAGLSLLLALFLASGLRVNSYLVDGVNPRHPLARDLHWIDAQGFGLFQIVLYVQGSPQQPLNSLAMLHWSEDYQQHFEQDDLVTGSFSLADDVKRVNMALQGNDPKAYVLPASAAENQQISAQIKQYLQPASKYVWLPDKQRGQIVLWVRDQGSQRMQQLFQKLHTYLKDHPPPVQSQHLTGTVQMAQTSFDRTLSGFGSSLSWAIGLIFICMLLLLRSLRYSLIALIPNLLPLIWLLATLQVLHFSLEPTTVLVFSIAYGLAVDNTIHFLSHFQAQRQKGKNVPEALQAALLLSGRAMLLTSLVLGAGFVGLMLSAFKALFLFGLLIAISLIFALIGDLLVLPAALELLAPRD